MLLDKIRQFIGMYWRRAGLVLGLFVFVSLLAVLVNYAAIGRYDKFIYAQKDQLPSNSSVVGLVFGGGVDNGKPRPLLQDRLDTAATLLAEGRVRKLIVSGDNRVVSYNEPQAMKDYLINEKRVAAQDIQLDNAGRSTYETCERASKIFSLKKVVLISESTHLPRAIYTCRSFGVEAFGFRSDGQSASGMMVGQRFREVLARTKATLNIYFIGEETILGKKIKV